jgi:hypothetical protein
MSPAVACAHKVHTLAIFRQRHLPSAGSKSICVGLHSTTKTKHKECTVSVTPYREPLAGGGLSDVKYATLRSSGAMVLLV